MKAMKNWKKLSMEIYHLSEIKVVQQNSTLFRVTDHNLDVRVLIYRMIIIIIMIVI